MNDAPSALRCGLYRLQDEGPEPLLRLYQTVYGDAEPMRQRLNWELRDRPNSAGAMIFAARVGGDLVGITVRMPCQVMVNGTARRAFFATNSMIHPRYRGQGVIRELYALAASGGELQLSKGTAPGMYRVLLEMGYRPIAPDNYMACLLAPFKWGIGKLLPKLSFRLNESFSESSDGEFRRISRFSEDDVALVNGVCETRGGVVKDCSTLNWRYLDIPHRRYHVFMRKSGGAACSLVVLRVVGLTAHLVDIRWNEQALDEPETSVRFAKAYARKTGALKLVCWCTLKRLREALRQQSFFERPETPRFSFHSIDGTLNQIDWSNLHFVHGDGDTEYV